MPKARMRSVALDSHFLTLLLGLFCFSGASDLEAETRTRAGLQALYDFSAGGGHWIQDRSRVGQALNLRISKPAAVRWGKNSLQLQKPTQIRSVQPAHKLSGAIRRSGEITVEAWITPANIEQKGPARIVTLSKNSTERNFTLGQEADQYDFRLRTLNTSNNGSPSLSTKKEQVSARLTHVVYTRNRAGLARIYLDGKKAAEKTISGAVYNWNGQFRLALGNEFGADRAWRGAYHLVALYARALLPKEVEVHYQAGPDAKTPQPSLAASPSPNAKLFTDKIAPLLAEHCLECHDAGTRKGKLDLSRRETAFAGSSSGEVIVPGNAAESYLLESVIIGEMPKDREPLSSTEQAWIQEWIDGGASWPIEVEIDPALFVHGGNIGESWTRRLTVSEYIQSVRSAVDVDIAEEVRALLPQDLRADGFSNTAYNLNVDLQHINAYARLAETIVAKMDVEKFAGRFSKSRLLTDDSMRGLIGKMGKWILRGPLKPYEVTLYRGLSTTAAAAGGDFQEAVSLIINAMLQSPRFLYRIENQRGDGTRWPVTEHELASRISYILWGAPPDQRLLKAAESGALFSESGLDEQIARMLQDPRAVRRSKDFIAEWLHLDRLNNLQPNAEKFPNWEHQLAIDMRQETLTYFEDLVWKQRRPLHNLFDAQFTYASPKLAAHYNLSSIEKETPLARYDLSKQPGRGGLLTHGSVLTVGGDEASMVSRGLFILHDLLRGVVKDPPPCVDTTPVPSRPGLTQRTIAEQRIANVQCGGCHGKFEPLAFGLEKFDGVGAYRETDEHGNKLRDDGEILFPGAAKTAIYNSSEELMQILADSERLRESLTWKLTQFAIGRPLVFADASAVDKIHQKAQKNGGTYQSLITEIIKSEFIQTTLTEANQ